LIQWNPQSHREERPKSIWKRDLGRMEANCLHLEPGRNFRSDKTWVKGWLEFAGVENDGLENDGIENDW